MLLQQGINANSFKVYIQERGGDLMNTLYIAIGIIVLIMGVITYYNPRAVRYISFSRRPYATSVMTLFLGVFMIILGLIV